MNQNRQDENPGAVMTLGEVAATLGITACRVRQIERRALIKLRCVLRKRGLTIYDLVIDREAVSHPLARKYL